MSNQSQNTQNLPTTPDWSKAPEWAKYFAMSENGNGWWLSFLPKLKDMRWLDSKKENYATAYAGRFDDTNLQAWLIQRPTIENLTVQLNTDISGYLAGKNSFITGLVDLLLARMAKEERFSDDENSIHFGDIKPHDVIIFSDENSDKNYAIAWDSFGYDGELYVSYGCIAGNEFGINGTNTLIDTETEFRTITELEAVEFRTAMEAVYG